jgi:hypothetical protein
MPAAHVQLAASIPRVRIIAWLNYANDVVINACAKNGWLKVSTGLPMAKQNCKIQSFKLRLTTGHNAYVISHVVVLDKRHTRRLRCKCSLRVVEYRHCRDFRNMIREPQGSVNACSVCTTGTPRRCEKDSLDCFRGVATRRTPTQPTRRARVEQSNQSSTACLRRPLSEQQYNLSASSPVAQWSGIRASRNTRMDLCKTRQETISPDTIPHHAIPHTNTSYFWSHSHGDVKPFKRNQIRKQVIVTGMLNWQLWRRTMS